VHTHKHPHILLLFLLPHQPPNMVSIRLSTYLQFAPPPAFQTSSGGSGEGEVYALPVHMLWIWLLGWGMDGNMFLERVFEA